MWPFVKKISAELSKLHSMCQWKNLEEVCVLKKKFFLFGHSLTNIRPFVGFFFRLGCQNYFLGVQRRVLRKNSCLIFWNHFRPLGIKCRPFVDEGLWDCQNYFLGLDRNNLMKNDFLKLIFYHIRHWTKKIEVFVGNFEAELSKLLPTCPEESFEEIFFSFSDIER